MVNLCLSECYNILMNKSVSVVSSGLEMKDPPPFPLTISSYVLELMGMFFSVGVAMGTIFLPQYFTWIPMQEFIAVILLSVAIIHAILFTLKEVTRKHIYFTLARYEYVLFFLFYVAFSGAVDSSFIFLLMFPILATVIYLDEKTTKRVSLFLFVFFAAMIFIYDFQSITPALITKHLIQTIIFGSMLYLMYRIVLETLHQKYQKEKISHRLTEMVQLDKLKSDFLSVAQHRLRTPLTGVKWALETLRSDKTLSENVTQIVDDSLKRVGDSIDIVNDMLKTVEKAKEGRLNLVYENFDVAKMVNSIIQELEFIALKKKIIVKSSVPEMVTIEGDKEKIRAAFTNIIDNAYKYSPNGKVEISLKQVEHSLEFMVSDSGIGIDPSDLPYIFDRLHRGKNAVKLEPDESGVGLYTSKKVIELHGGTISVSSNLGAGTTVVAELPLKKIGENKES